VTKNVPDDHYLLNRNKIKTDIPEISQLDLEAYLLQNSNNYTFGFMRIKLGLYNLAGSDTAGWLNRWLRRIGEPPVIYDQQLTERTQEMLTKVMRNRGYIDSQVEVALKTKRKRIHVSYRITGCEPYRIGKYQIDLPDDSAMVLLGQDTTAIVAQALFDVDALNMERDRVTSLLRRHGYYNVQKNMLHFLADSATVSHQVDLRMVLQEQYMVDSVKSLIFHRKKINSVTIHCITDMETLSQQEIDFDTTVYNGYTVISEKGKRLFTHKLLTTKTAVRAGDWYNEQSVDRTYSNLNSLSAVKYVNIGFQERKDGMLDCAIYITPEKKLAFSVEVDGTHSDGDLGASLELSYQNKNIFKGAETFRIGMNGAFEAMGKVGQFYHSSSVGGEMSLRIPSLAMPFIKDDFRRRYSGSTQFSISYNFQQRPGYRRNIANMGMSYSWHARRYGFNYNLLDISYIYLPWISDAFRSRYLTPSSSIRFSYENHLIMRMGFGINYSNYEASKPLRNYCNFRGNVTVAGNFLYAMSHLFQHEKDSNGGYNIFSTRYAQYAKSDFDFGYHHIINSRNQLIFHAAFGIGFPYGNTTILPFEERYFCGGANSLRGWSARWLGPGSYKNSMGYIDYMNQSGDIKLEMNIESRFKLFWKLNGAVFIDAGNIWTIKEYNEQPGGLFRFGDFYRQIACNYGVGLRLDFSFLVLRVDMGIKLFDPSYTSPHERWRTELSWANDVAFHFAVGYPF
jgi:outer membrane protein assembly factor BamA